MSEAGKTAYAPTDGLSYDPTQDKYWHKEALRKELGRVFEVCHGCRMCFKYCDAFPALFRFIDERHDGKASLVTEAETAEVMDQCFQCKLCEVQCPYTPRDGHEFQLDFPKLVHRYQAVRVREQGVSLRARILGNPDAAAQLARASLGMANVMNQVSLHRWLLEKTVGVHRHKLLPEFASQTFEAWAMREGWIRPESGGEAILFQTCFVQHNDPQLGKDVIEVLQRSGVDIRCAAGLQCCGMPAWESGDLESLWRLARANLDALEPFVDQGAKVLVINPTCAMMLRREYPELLPVEDRARARKVAEAVRDPGEYLWSLRNEERFNVEFASAPGPIAYHAPCHLRAQAIGFKGRDLLRKTGQKQITTVMECCGHNGTYAMKVEGFEASARLGRRAFDEMKAAEAAVWATDCPLATLQFEQHAGRRPLHPMSILARAYRGEPFDDSGAGGS